MRVGFSEKTTTTTNSATLENATQTTEQATFRNYGNRSALSIFNKTPGGTYSQVLNGGNNNQIGLAKSFEVNPGDVFDLEVYGKYEQPTATGNNLNTLFTALASAFTLNPSGGTGLEGQQAYNAFNGLFGGGPAITTGEWEDDNAPKAYLNYILFNESFVLMDMGWDQISYSAKQVGVTPVVAHDYMSLHVKVKQKGYLYIYLSNENPNVYFDDLKIKRSTAIEQVANYYAFGLAQNSNGFERQGGIKNPLLYNGKELQDELNMGWLDYGARMYMPELGRWGVVDPLSDRRLWVSPYNYVQNNPISRFDPTGMLDDYAMDTETGNINLIKKTNDKTDKLVDKKTNKVIASKVEKGLLKDGQNIKQNGLETSKVKSGIELVVKISMHIEQEITGTVYGSDDGKKNYLKVEPYKNAKKVIGKDNNDFYMTTGVSSKIEKFFKSSDRTFSGKAVAAFHTHPGWRC